MMLPSSVTSTVEFFIGLPMQLGLNWDFKLVASNEVNAFCMPSGRVVFY